MQGFLRLKNSKIRKKNKMKTTLKPFIVYWNGTYRAKSLVWATSKEDIEKNLLNKSFNETDFEVELNYDEEIEKIEEIL